MRSGSNNTLLIARAPTNVHRYIMTIWWRVPLLCLRWLTLLCLLLLLRRIVGIVCVWRHSRRRRRLGDRCCRAVRRRSSYSFACSAGVISPADYTITTATVGTAAVSRATQSLLAFSVLGVCCFQICVHDLELSMTRWTQNGQHGPGCLWVP